MICLTLETLDKIKRLFPRKVVDVNEYEIVLIDVYDWNSSGLWLGKDENGIDRYEPYPSNKRAIADGLIPLALQERANQFDYGFVGGWETKLFEFEESCWWAFFPGQHILPVELWPDDLDRSIMESVGKVAKACSLAKRKWDLKFPT